MNKHELMNQALERLVGGTPGDNLLVEFKKCMMKEVVFRTLFGQNGERIFIDKTFSLNTQIIPLIELRWKRDSQQSQETYLNGTIEGRMIFPGSLIGGDFNKKRMIALMFLRLLNSDYFDLWDRVDGLIMFGENASVDYSVAFTVGTKSLPGILINIPYQIDVHLWRLAHPEIDPYEELGGEEFRIDSYELDIDIDNDGVIEDGTNDIIINGDSDDEDLQGP